MSGFTIGEKILLHMSRYELLKEDPFSITWDLTQDGIASSLRITRAHSSLVLKKLRESGKILEEQNHVNGFRTKRKSYRLTPAGMEEAKRLKDIAEKEGIDIAPMLDMKRCDPHALWDSVEEEDRDVLGLACVMRRPVHRSSLPETSRPVMPADVNGMIMLNDIVKKKVVSVADAERVRGWHSAAADYWLDRDEVRERLYHLICADRMRDVCRLIVNEKERLLYDIDDDLSSILSKLNDIPEKNVADVMPVKITVALRSGDLRSSVEMIDILKEKDMELGLLYSADLEIEKGNSSAALSMITSIGRTARFDVDLRIAGALGRLGRTAEALDMLTEMKDDLVRSGTVDGLDRVYILMADISSASNDNDSSINYLTKALGVSNDTEKKRIYSLLASSYSAIGMSKKAEECLARSQ